MCSQISLFTSHMKPIIQQFLVIAWEFTSLLKIKIKTGLIKINCLSDLPTCVYHILKVILRIEHLRVWSESDGGSVGSGGCVVSPLPKLLAFLPLSYTTTKTHCYFPAIEGTISVSHIRCRTSPPSALVGSQRVRNDVVDGRKESRAERSRRMNLDRSDTRTRRGFCSAQG